MRFRAYALALGLGALAATPCLALTIQAAPPRPDVAQHLHSSTPASGAFATLPADRDVAGSWLAPGRPMIGQGLNGSPTVRTTSFSFGPVHATTTFEPGYGASWNSSPMRDEGNPLALTPHRRPN